MSYQVIARKYRPQHFADVVGQEHVTQTLSNAIRQKRIAHAYLFVGPRGTGKTTIARIFAKCLNCTGGPKDVFPDDDPRCVEITEGRSMDVLEIDGASNRGIEEIRELRDTVRYVPATSKFKIYIIDEVHMLTKEAFNALLKTLEEPPEHVKFMFATTEPEKVLPTILSRCQRFDLRRIPSLLIVKHLASIAQTENVKIDEAALHAIARGAEGGMRDAESTLDQLISFCGSEIVENDVLSMFGLTARSQILALAGAILEGNVGTALRELNELAKNGKDLGRLLGDLLNHFRNLLIYQVSKGDLNMLEVSEAEASALASQSSLANADSLGRIMEVFTDCEGRLKDATSKKVVLEVTLLKAIQARNAVSIDSVLQKLEQMRAGRPTATAAPAPAPTPVAPPPAPIPVAAPAPKAAQPAPPPAPRPSAPMALAETPAPAVPPVPTYNLEPDPAPVPEAPPAFAAAPSADRLEEMWAGVVDAVGRASPFTKTYLVEAHPVSFQKNTLTIGIDPEFSDHFGLVDNPKTRTLIQTKLHELGLKDATVKIVMAPTPPGRAPRPAPPAEVPQAKPAPTAAAAPARPPAPPEPKVPAPQPAVYNTDDFKNDPLIRKALEIFKGQIVEVRA